jgi:hypothetical protein
MFSPPKLPISASSRFVMWGSRKTAYEYGSSAPVSPAIRPVAPTASRASQQKQIPGSMRMTLVLALAYYLVTPAYSSVTILSEQYHCSGETMVGSPETGYSHTDSLPVYSSRNDEWGGASSAAWKFGAMASTGTASEWASASSTFVFTVDKPILIIKITGNLWSHVFADIWGGISYSLTDNLTNEIIGSRSWSLSDEDENEIEGWWERSIEESTTFNLINGNRYRLLLSANVTNADGSDARIEAVLIPEPSSFLLTSIGALYGLLIRRRV